MTRFIHSHRYSQYGVRPLHTTTFTRTLLFFHARGHHRTTHHHQRSMPNSILQDTSTAWKRQRGTTGRYEQIAPRDWTARTQLRCCAASLQLVILVRLGVIVAIEHRVVHEVELLAMVVDILNRRGCDERIMASARGSGMLTRAGRTRLPQTLCGMRGCLPSAR